MLGIACLLPDFEARSESPLRSHDRDSQTVDRDGTKVLGLTLTAGAFRIAWNIVGKKGRGSAAGRARAKSLAGGKTLLYRVH